MKTEEKTVTTIVKTFTLSQDELEELILKALDAKGGEVTFLGRDGEIDGVKVVYKRKSQP